MQVMLTIALNIRDFACNAAHSFALELMLHMIRAHTAMEQAHTAVETCVTLCPVSMSRRVQTCLAQLSGTMIVLSLRMNC